MAVNALQGRGHVWWQECEHPPRARYRGWVFDLCRLEMERAWRDLRQTPASSFGQASAEILRAPPPSPAVGAALLGEGALPYAPPLPAIVALLLPAAEAAA